MKVQELDWGRCPDCGEELFNISDHEENVVMCTKCGKTFPEPPLGPVTKKRKAKKGKELRLPFGKHKGRTLREIMHEDPSYLAWFYDSVEDQQDIKAAMEALPEFPMQLAKYRERKEIRGKSIDRRIEETVSRMFAVEPSPAQLDALCNRLFNEGSEGS